MSEQQGGRQVTEIMRELTEIRRALADVEHVGNTAISSLLGDAAASFSDAGEWVGIAAAGQGPQETQLVSDQLASAWRHAASAVSIVDSAAGEIDAYVSFLGGSSSKVPASAVVQESPQQAPARSSRPRSRGRGGGRRRQDRRPAAEFEPEDVLHNPQVRAQSIPRFGEGLYGFTLKVGEFELAMRGIQHSVLLQTPYNAIAARSAREVRRGVGDALYVPAAQIILDTTLSALSQPDVARRLPREVHERMAIARVTAEITSDIVTGSLLGVFYSNNEFLSGLVGKRELAILSQQNEYFSSLSRSMFNEVSVVAGGALRALRAYGDVPNAREIISSSTDLKMLAGVKKEEMVALLERLGTPYMREEYYDIELEGGVPVGIKLTAEARKIVHDAFGAQRGCPARGMRSSDGDFKTELDRGWHDVVNFLIPDGATVAMDNAT